MFERPGPSLLELAHQALSSTSRGYDLLAPRFDHTPFRTPDALVELAVEAAVAEFDEPPSVGLDLCCGTGVGVRALSARCSNEVVGVDFSLGMLDEARRRVDPAAAPVRFVEGDVLHLPFEARFDLVTCFGALGHIAEADGPRFAAQVASALAPGGRFLIITMEEAPASWRGTWLARGFNAAMHVRNALRRPRFVMFYLTFLLPRATALLEAEGLKVEVLDVDVPWPRGVVVTATRPG